MKTLIIVLLLLVSCGETKNNRGFYQSKHELRQIYQRDGLHGSVGGAMMMGFGSVAGSVSTNTYYILWWKDGEVFCCSKIPIEKMRFCEVGYAPPEISFELVEYDRGVNCSEELDEEYTITQRLRYATIYSSKEDLPLYIQISNYGTEKK